ncbi:MAG TPA: phosphoribosylanthranilate isomerase [Polyangia bacterium]|jgi:phosphoribosylanthranilate isomerase|nr:phosphoribosylanthranilate isomerase [Polyangia bacterium]
MNHDGSGDASAARPFIVKICGITSVDDAKGAVAAGADAVGVNLWPDSKRFVDDATARAVLAVLPAHVIKFGVFVNAPADEIASRIVSLGLDRAQLHGNEQARDYATLDAATVVRAVRVRDEATFQTEAMWRPGLWLYDAFAPGFGGSGSKPPWPLVAKLARRPFLLAGGLTPDNVAAAIAAVRPDGVDVASGVERSPGIKDATRVARFVEAARAAARSI